MNHQVLRKCSLQTLTICFWLLKCGWGVVEGGRERTCSSYQHSSHRELLMAKSIVNLTEAQWKPRQGVSHCATSFCFFENCLSWSAERVEKHVINTMFDVRPSVSMKPLKQHRGIVRESLSTHWIAVINRNYCLHRAIKGDDTKNMYAIKLSKLKFRIVPLSPSRHYFFDRYFTSERTCLLRKVIHGSWP